MSANLISRYDNLTNGSNKPIKIIDELYLIKSDTNAGDILNCREILNTKGKGEYDKIKRQLSAVTFSACYEGQRLHNYLVEYSHHIVFDIDYIDDIITEVKLKISTDKYVLACWISPSGKGLKVLINTDATIETHKHYFSNIADYLENEYDVTIDRSGSDISRLCFTSFDPNLYLNESSVKYALDMEKYKIDLKYDQIFKSPKNSSILEAIDKQLFHSPLGRNGQANRKTMKQIIVYLQKKNLSITNTYHDWLKVGFAIANTFTFDLGKKIFLDLCKLDGNKHDENKSQAMIEHCYLKRRIDMVQFSTIVYLAQKQGFRLL